MRKIALLTAMLLLSMSGGPVNSWAETRTNTPRNANQEQAVRKVVTELGDRLRMVPLLAPKEIAAEAMDREYSALVSAELLAAWKNDPENAPGKQTSSPWPKRIDITSVAAKAPDTYLIKGKVILITTSGSGGAGDKPTAIIAVL